MDKRQYERVAEIFVAVVETPEAERDQFLQQQCGHDEALRAAVERLLAKDEAGTLIESEAAQTIPPANGAQRDLCGTTLSRYSLIELVGEGGMARVYRARDEVLHRDIAVKVLKSDGLPDAVTGSSPLREARAAAALEHNNICGVYEIGEDNAQTFIAMPFLEGRTVAELIKDGALPVDQALDIAIQCARGLAAAHKKGIVHRDIKPGNLMMLDSGVVKIMDFGISQRNDDSTLTKLRLTAGTVSYMPPEQIEGSDVDHRADLWALGVVLYEMIEGRVPFEGEDLIRTLSLISSGPLQPLSVAADVPELDAAIRKLLEKRRGDRFQDAAHLLEELTKQLAAMSAAETAAEPVAWLGRPRTVGLALAAVLVTIFSLRLMTGPTPPKDASMMPTPSPLSTDLGNESDPALSRDGGRVAYSWSDAPGDATDIYVREVGSGGRLQLTDNRRLDHSPTWSPDGERVAFLRCDGGTEHALITVPAAGGEEREIATLAVGEMREGSVGISWSPRDEAIAVGGALWNGRGGHVVLVSLLDGSTTAVAESLTGRRDFAPSFSPDGSKLAFNRWASRSDSQTAVVDMDTQELQTYQTLAEGSHAWTDEGKSIVFSRISGPSRASLWMLDVDGGEIERLPIVTSAAASPTIAGNRLAFMQLGVNINLWEFELADSGSSTFSVGAGGGGQRLISSTQRQHSPDFSPDGESLVFVSDRRGPLDLWLAAADGSNARQLTHANPKFLDSDDLSVADSLFSAGSPRWSPNGREIAFDGLYGEKTVIFVISADGGEPRRLTLDDSFNRVPTWSRDGKWIYFSSTRTDRREVWRLPAEGGLAVQMTFAKGHVSEESPDGRVLYYDKGLRPPGLWQTRLPKGGEEHLPEFDDIVPRFWRVVSDGVIFLAATAKDPDEPKWELRRFKADTREVTVLASVTVPVNISAAGFAVSPDEKSLLLPSLDRNDQDLMLVENFR